MNPRLLSLAMTFIAAIGLSGCNRGSPNASVHADHDHDHEESSGAEVEPVSFAEGRGLQLSPAVNAALKLSLAEVETQPLSEALRLPAHVFATTPRVVASATIPAALVPLATGALYTDAELLRTEPRSRQANGAVDLIFALRSSAEVKVGQFVELTGKTSAHRGLTVPSAAVIDGATGEFVYVANGDAFLRTPVQIGRRTSDRVEITEGLFEGDKVVASSGTQLWLAELRLTKGGGHSH